MSTLWPLVRKELLLLTRDWHALALLFVMPAFFILVMSLAMRDMFTPGRDGVFTYYLVRHDSTPMAEQLAAGLAAHRAFRAVPAPTDSLTRLDAVRRGDVSFALTIPAGFTAAMVDSQPVPIALITGPGVNVQSAQLFAAAVREALSGVFVQAKMRASIPLLALQDEPIDVGGIDKLLSERTLYRDADTRDADARDADARDADTGVGDTMQRPTSVQQNVPAWLVFAMFFVALPLSTTWLQERTQGTLSKLRSIGVGSGVLLAGKLLPYLAVNLVQVLVMIAVGLWIVPALGGDALTLGSSVAALFVMSVAVAMAAVSYALLIANLVATTEQATIVAGASNLLLGALGGVMVPRHVMPPEMQSLSYFSPMAWGLEGFLDVFLREGTVLTVLPRAGLLLAFAAISLMLAGFRLQRTRTS